MAQPSHKKRIWGWMMFDFASQPYHTLIITFIFAPFFAELMIDHLTAVGIEPTSAKAQAQSTWGAGVTVAGIFIAVLAPILGALADTGGRKMPWITGFSLAYVVGAAGLWFVSPLSFDPVMAMAFFAIGVIGVEFTTIFTNALLPDLGDRDEIGRISGNGWAWGYIGGLVALVLMLVLFAENAEGVTVAGMSPLFGFDAAAREGTRFVGPFTALWFIVSMIPFYLWVKEPKTQRPRSQGAVGKAMKDLGATLKSLPKRRSLFSFLGASMFYRDALNGVFAFGGIYAVGVLEWSAVQFGIFGILAIISGAIFTYVGGFADQIFGPKPVIRFSIWVLMATCFVIITISRESVLFIAVEEGSTLPDTVYMVCGVVIGAVSGVIQAASRTMMVRQADPERMTEAFGLYALSGKATTFLAPMLITAVTYMTGSQSLGITPIVGLFIVGLVLLVWVHPEGDPDALDAPKA